MIEAFWWYVCLLIPYLAILPTSRRLFRSFPSGVVTLGIPFSLLVYGYMAWILASLRLLSYTSGNLILLVILIAQLNWGLETWKNRRKWRQELPLGRDVWMGHLLCIAGFILFVAIKQYFPEIVGDKSLNAAEKFPDFMMLQSCVSTIHPPPPDLWYAGEGYHLNHYYFGYFLVSIITKLSGTPSRIAYNLGLATLFSMGLGASYSLACRFSNSKLGGALGSLFLLICANLYGLVHLFAKGNRSVPTFGIFEFWKASRVIEIAQDRTINEFPCFSFLLGDLHPHLLSLPFVLLFLAFLIALDEAKTRQQKGAFALCVGLTFGALSVCNSWDLPTFGCLLVGTMILHAWTRRCWSIPWAVGGLLLMVGTAGLLFLPYHLNYIRPPLTIRKLPLQVKTHLTQFCVVHGLFLWILLGELLWGNKECLKSKFWLPPALTALVVNGIGYFLLFKELTGTAQWGWWLLHVAVATPMATLLAREILLLLRPILPAPPRPLCVGIVLLLALLFPFAEKLAGASVAVFMGVLLVIVAARILRKLITENSFQFCHLMIFLACGCLLGCEFIYLEDIYGGTAKRMNTVFKFYYQAWILLSLACAVFAYRLVFPTDRRRSLSRWLWISCLAVLLCGSLVYTVRAIPVRCDHFQRVLQRPTLDGLLHLKTSPESVPVQYNGFAKDVLTHSAQEYDTLVWMRDSCEDPGTVIEATGGPYTHYSRVGTFTGWPTLLGWGNHEWLWRGWALKEKQGIEGVPYERQTDIRELYQTLDTRKAVGILDQYEVDYVFVGGLERKDFYQESEHGLLKFDLLADRVREDGDVVLFKRREEATLAAVAPYVPSGPAPGGEYREVKLASESVPRIGHIPPLAQWQGSHKLGQLKDIAVGPKGTVYAADVTLHQVHVFSHKGELLESWGKEGEKEGLFNQPSGLGVSSDGRVFVADTWNHRVQVFDSEGRFQRLVLGKEVGFWAPKDVVVAPSGEFFVVDTGQHSIHRFSRDYQEILVWGRRGNPGELPEDLWEPVGAALGPDGNLYVTDTGHRRVQVFTPNGALVRTWRVLGWDDFYTEPYLCFDLDGNVLLSDSRNDRIQRFTPEGNLLSLWQTKELFEWPIGLALSMEGRLLLSDSRNGRILVFKEFPKEGPS